MPRSRREHLTYPINVRQLEVRAIRDLGPGMRRITLSGPQLGAFTTADGIAVPPLRNEGFDDHVKVIVAGPGQSAPVPPIQVEGHLDWNPPGGRPEGKDYTPRRYDSTTGELDLDFVRHGTGPAATWAEQVRVGDPAWIAGPKDSLLLPREVDWLLVAGDSTALPAIGRLLEELPDDAVAHVFVEIPNADHEIPLDPGPKVTLSWLHTDTSPSVNPLAQAIRDLDWPDGQVYAWVAGEATALKEIRSYLKHERQVPRDCLEVTGYWRRPVTTSASAASSVEQVESPEEPDAHARLHELAELTGAYALRAAVTCGLIEAVDREPATIEALAASTGSHEPTLRSLVAYLIEVDVLTSDEQGRIGLGPIGAELVEDDHSLAEYHLDGPQAALDLAIAGLAETLRTGGPVASRDGRTLADRLAAEPVLAGQARSATEEEALWTAPSVADHLDWSRYASVVALGPGSGQSVSAILRAHPELRATVVDLPSALAVVRSEVIEESVAERITLVEQSPLAPLPVSADAALAVQLLEQLPDPDAILVLRQLLAAPVSDIVLVETSTAPDTAVDEELAEADLRSRCAFGVGIRTVADLTALVTSAGGRVAEVRDLGWGLHLLELARS